MASSTATSDLVASVTKLSLKTSINTNLRANPEKKKKSAPVVADSWEDEASSGSDTETEDTPLGNNSHGAGTNAPPPTPLSPVGSQSRPFSPSALASPSTYGGPPSFDGPGIASQSSATPAKRPEKTDAVARRMIAAGLGLKAPRATEEQRAYDKAVREKERKRREEERELARKKEEEAAKAKQAVWDD
ncbi:hypothetical protein QBC35DRAFT_10529 [Podospora australis]|uniref:Ubiquitin smt3 n=1 Tax=Podospora australis TaxID=1536484 RepID=A0AAN6X4X9_9PEZI|nr:hypothetical protein QBC35DRAFT_10529 [Podospora australis]